MFFKIVIEANRKKMFEVLDLASRKGFVGFLTTSNETDGIYPTLKPGMVFDKKTNKPPFIVVDHELHSMIVPNWPVKLWKVKILKPIKPQGHVGNYTRCRAIKVLEMLPSYKVFGETDTGVVEVLQFAQALTSQQAEMLSKKRADDAPEIFSQSWKRWAMKNDIESYRFGDDFDGVTKFGQANGGSPIRAGLSLIHKIVFDQAGKEVGEQAYDYEEDGTPYLKAPWDTACATLMDAVMSFGASDLFDQDGIAKMREPLRQVLPELVNLIEEG